MSPGHIIGEIEVGRNYVQTSNGTPQIEIAGNDPMQHDALTVIDNATVDGRLEVASINGFVPNIGTNEIVMANQVQGQFRLKSLKWTLEIAIPTAYQKTQF